MTPEEYERELQRDWHDDGGAEFWKGFGLIVAVGGVVGTVLMWLAGFR